MTKEENIAAIRAWYARISDEARIALELVGVVWTEYDIWTGGPYFMTPVGSRTPKPTDDPEVFARKILDDVAGQRIADMGAERVEKS